MKNSRSYYHRNDQLSNVDYKSPSLPSKDAGLFNRHVARLFFVSKKAKPDIQVYVVFLCTRVKAPIEQDYKKLGRVISYLNETVHLSLVIEADYIATLTCNIDASFTVHLDFKSHSGACLTLGNRSVLSISVKQKINTTSSIKTERVGVDDAMTFVMWMNYFFESQIRPINMNSPLKPL